MCQVYLDCNIYFLFEKQTFKGLLKVIVIQNLLDIYFSGDGIIDYQYSIDFFFLKEYVPSKIFVTY